MPRRATATIGRGVFWSKRFFLTRPMKVLTDIGVGSRTHSRAS